MATERELQRAWESFAEDGQKMIRSLLDDGDDESVRAILEKRAADQKNDDADDSQIPDDDAGRRDLAGRYYDAVRGGDDWKKAHRIGGEPTREQFAEAGRRSPEMLKKMARFLAARGRGRRYAEGQDDEDEWDPSSDVPPTPEQRKRMAGRMWDQFAEPLRRGGFWSYAELESHLARADLGTIKKLYAAVQGESSGAPYDSPSFRGGAR
jgi:hypothetical protein